MILACPYAATKSFTTYSHACFFIQEAFCTPDVRALYLFYYLRSHFKADFITICENKI